MPSKTALRGAQAPTTQKKSTDESSRPHALSSGPPCCVCSRRARPPCAMFACPPGASSAPARGSGATGARPGARLRVPSPPRPRGSRGSAAARPLSASRPGAGLRGSARPAGLANWCSRPHSTPAPSRRKGRARLRRAASARGGSARPVARGAPRPAPAVCGARGGRLRLLGLRGAGLARLRPRPGWVPGLRGCGRAE